MGTRKSASVEPLLAVELGAGKVKFAQGIKAGRWVFATGVMAQDFITGIAPDVLAERLPHGGLPKREKEALRIFENVDAVLRAAGTDRSNLVRTDQYYTTVKAVPAYQQVRREFLSGRIPPSTSIAQQGLLLPGADMNIQAMGVIPQPGFEVTHLKHEAARRPADLGLFAGADGRRFRLHSRHHLACDRRRAAAQRRRRGRADDRGHAMGRSADQARNPVHCHQRMAQSLALAGAKPRRRGARPDLSGRPRGLFRLQRGVVAAFRRSRPDARRIPCIDHGLAPYDGKIEINVIALNPAARPQGHRRRRSRRPRSATSPRPCKSAISCSCRG